MTALDFLISILFTSMNTSFIGNRQIVFRSFDGIEPFKKPVFFKRKKVSRISGLILTQKKFMLAYLKKKHIF